MGKIHDKIKARAVRINSLAPTFTGRKSDKQRQIDALTCDLAAVRADRSIGAATRHHMLQGLADKAKALGLKGRWNLLCNRTQCLRPDAVWYNRGSYAFYCVECAVMLNRDNARDAEELLGAGEKLCVHIATAEAAAELHVSR